MILFYLYIITIKQFLNSFYQLHIIKIFNYLFLFIIINFYMIVFLIILNLFSIYHQMFIILFNLLDWKDVILYYVLELIMGYQTFILLLLSIIIKNMICLFITFWLLIDNRFLRLKYFKDFQLFIFIVFLNLLFIIRYLVIYSLVHFLFFLFIHLIRYCC